MLREVAALGQPMPSGIEVRVSGANAARGYQQACALAESGAAALISFGLAGGLDPRLGPGRVIIGTEVLAVEGAVRDPRGAQSLGETLGAIFSMRGHAVRRGEAPPPVTVDERYTADQRLIELLFKVGGKGAVVGPIAGVDHLVRTRDEKAALLVKTRALVADMESQGVARAATERGLPFGVIRVVVDPSNRELPEALARAVRPDGSTALAPILNSLLLNPFGLGGYMSVALDSAIALRRLGRVGRNVGAALLGCL